MYTVLKLFWPFEDNCEADVVPNESEFDTPGKAYFGRFDQPQKPSSKIPATEFERHRSIVF